MNWSNILERAAWTGVQAAVAAVPVSQIAAAISGGDISNIQQLALSAIGAATAAVLSFVKTIAVERIAATGQSV